MAARYASSRTRPRRSSSYRDDPLKKHSIPSYKDGYNSYSASKTLIKDTEVGYGLNSRPDDNGSMSKRAGKAAASPVLSAGHAIMGLGELKTASLNLKLAACDTSVYTYDDSSKTALTGFAFTADLDTDFCQAVDRAYVANGTDALYYTTDGTSLTAQSNGVIGRSPVSFNQRLYILSSTYPDRIYYSNPYSIDLTANPPTFASTNFGTFDTSLPTKNAGYIILDPGTGVNCTRLQKDGDYLYAYTEDRGTWQIGAVATANADGSIAHTVKQVIGFGGCPAPRSVFISQNDKQYFGGDNLYSYGEVAYYQSPRTTVKSGRIRSEMRTIPAAGKSQVAAAFFNNCDYVAYRAGSYNDRVVVRDTVLNAWSTPYTGWNVSCFLAFTENDGRQRLLAGSSDPSDSRVYELETGTDDAGSAIAGTFEDKSTDCGFPGIVKRFAFIRVFYAMLYGTLTYEVFVDETVAVTGTIQLGNSSDSTAGFGSLPFGSFPLGAEFDGDATFASLRQNSYFTIDCGYEEGERVSVRFTNAVTGEQFKINGRDTYFLLGDEQEELT